MSESSSYDGYVEITDNHILASKALSSDSQWKYINAISIAKIQDRETEIIFWASSRALYPMGTYCFYALCHNIT